MSKRKAAAFAAIHDSVAEETGEDSNAEKRAQRWREIEEKHFGMCVWQQRSPNAKAMLEGLLHKATGQIVIVEKGYEKRLPPEGSYESWPRVVWVHVYSMINQGTWDKLDEALTKLA